METVKNISSGILHGLWDSISGMTLLLYIDKEIHQIEEEKEQAEMERRQQAKSRRSPSPTPSSASSMEREEREKAARLRRERGNPDERTLESMRKSSMPPEPPKPKREKKIAKKVLKCCLLNGGFTWLSIVLFEYVLLPTLRFVLSLIYGEKSDDLHTVWGWLHPILSIIFGMMWVLPIFFLSKIVSSLWFADIANAAYRVRKGRPRPIPGLSKLIADFLFSIIVQALFLVQSMVVNFLSLMYIGPVLSFIHLCLLYSLYSFEYKWFNMGWELHRRLIYIEDNWPYFLGFGVPLTILTSLSSSIIVSGCIFSMFFPLFILSGNEAVPVVKTTETPLRLFVPVVFVSNLFFSRSRGKRSTKKQPNEKQQQQEQYDSVLTMEERFQLHQMKQEHYRELARRSSSREQAKKIPSSNSSASSVASSTSYRYLQPPPFPRKSKSPSPLQTKPESNFVGMRPLIPTPVHNLATASKGPANAQF